MIRQRLIRLFLPLAFAGACAVAVSNFAVMQRASRTETPVAKEAWALAVQWRAQMLARANVPCAYFGGWIVSDASGGVTALSNEGKRVWQSSFSNHVFDAGAVVVKDFALVASQQGQVFALRTDTGEVAWTRATEGRFQHAPLSGMNENEPVIWLVSQSDGQLICLRVRDGLTVWQGDATNRCDGEPIAWKNRIAYGNCDGAIYVFDAENGRLNGSVTVGAEDQMAGGLLAIDGERLAAGTRQGNLAVVNAGALTLEALVRVSQSEAFVTPVVCFDKLIAMGTSEGDVVYCRMVKQGTQLAGRFAVGAAVDRLLFGGGRLYVLAGGSLYVLAAPEGPAEHLALGDEVRGLSAGPDGTFACVADQAVVCIKGGAQ